MPRSRKHPALASIATPARLTAGSTDDLGLTAAGVKVDDTNASNMRRLIMPWQQRALAYYDICGEAWFAAQFYARHLSQVRLFVGVQDEDGQVHEVEEDSEATALLDRVRDPGGTGRSQLQGSYGRLMFITGEGYLTVTQPEGEEEAWEFLSPDELRVNQDQSLVRYSAPSLTPQNYQIAGANDYTPLDNTAVVYRIWRKHPRYSALADSPMKAVLDLFEELVLLQAAVLARVKSRLTAAGMLMVPEEITFPSQDGQAADEDMKDDPLLNALVEAANTAIREPGSASAVVPIIVRAQGEWIEKVKHLQFFDPAQAYPETGLRMEVIKRIAIGLDMPPEILLGLADSNHWTAWQIDEQTARAYVFPIAQQMCDDLTSAYFRPACREAGIEGWENLVIGYDPAAIVIAPDRASDAIQLHAKGVLSDEALRDAAGFTEEDAPSDEERAWWLGATVRDAGLAMFGIPTLKSGAELEPNAGEIEAPPAPGGGTESPPSGSGTEVTKGPPPAGPAESPSGMTASAADPTVQRVLGAAALSVLRARAAAGARLRSRLDKDEKDRHRDVPNGGLAAAVGSDRIAELGLSKMTLVDGGTSEFRALMVGLGFTMEQANAVGRQVEVWAAQNLTDENPPELPSQIAGMIVG